MEADTFLQRDGVCASIFTERDRFGNIIDQCAILIDLQESAIHQSDHIVISTRYGKYRIHKTRRSNDTFNDGPSWSWYGSKEKAICRKDYKQKGSEDSKDRCIEDELIAYSATLSKREVKC